MRSWHFWAILVVLLAVPGWAAEPTEYRFAPNDVIEITVSPQTGFDRTVTVQPDGKVSFPVVGQIQAAGLTVLQLVEELREGLSRQLVNPQVTVSLKERSERGDSIGRVSLLGAVLRPGVYDVTDGATAAEMLAMGGGPSPVADLRRVTITRQDQSVITVDLAQTDQTGRLERNVTLKPGDLMVVPEGARATVLVLGEVTKPGSYELPKGARLLDVLSLAGGPTTRADLRRVGVARAGQVGTRTVNLQPLLAGGASADLEANVALQPGDTILIAETEERVYVLGAVGRPDSYAIKPNDRLLDALLKAGGAAPGGDLTKAVLVRRDASGQPAPKPLDLKKIMAEGDIATNERVQPGDVLFVPDRKASNRRSGLDILYSLVPLAGLVNLFGGAR